MGAAGGRPGTAGRPRPRDRRAVERGRCVVPDPGRRRRRRPGCIHPPRRRVAGGRDDTAAGGRSPGGPGARNGPGGRRRRLRPSIRPSNGLHARQHRCRPHGGVYHREHGAHPERRGGAAVARARPGGHGGGGSGVPRLPHREGDLRVSGAHPDRRARGTTPRPCSAASATEISVTAEATRTCRCRPWTRSSSWWCRYRPLSAGHPWRSRTDTTRCSRCSRTRRRPASPKS